MLPYDKYKYLLTAVVMSALTCAGVAFGLLTIGAAQGITVWLVLVIGLIVAFGGMFVRLKQQKANDEYLRKQGRL